MTMFRFCFITLFFLAGCESTQIVNLNTVKLGTNGPVAINVQSFGGTVTIVANPKVIGTTVSATQYEDGLESVPVAELQMNVSTYFDSGPLGDTVHVIATCDDNPFKLISANIVIRSNNIHGVTVATARGDVTANGISGPVNIHTREGDVRIATPLAMNDSVTIENTHGNIFYRVRGESSGIIDATAVNGEATLDLRNGNAVILPGSTGEHLAAKFNDGTNKITMRTVGGNVRLFVIPNPVGSEPFFETDWISW